MRHAAGMLTTFGVASALLLAPSLAKATDLTPISPVRRRSSTEPPTWQGLYFGGNLGAAFDPNDLRIQDLSAAQDLTLQFSNSTEFIGGVHGGYNFQSGGLVLGVEGDIAFARRHRLPRKRPRPRRLGHPELALLRYRGRRVHRHQHEFRRCLRR